MKYQPTTIRLSFCIYGDYFDVDKVTDIIGLSPTETAYKGDQLKYRVSEETFWEYNFAPIETLLIEDNLQVFAAQIIPCLPALSSFIKGFALTSKLLVCVEMSPKESCPAIVFDNKILDILHRLNAWIDIDMYK
ncbi:DUF4279 domain-containing protein [Capnocytophaga sp. oral taxon 338]|uniref:DUF4279 domain-containing protein n=1 Tax=Capnocytophaga sp. oral taxon 338 TaxID=710239 RepID=UPI000202E953|nr:DUF4279 domain-containing protein [Capnocytophaga sp. oral taxon 338]EGD33106.1 hypothetical protein HMPREF9071_2299 [Capnocytophaga sp. oral taxon 338 str. F0234]